MPPPIASDQGVKSSHGRLVMQLMWLNRELAGDLDESQCCLTKLNPVAGNGAHLAKEWKIEAVMVERSGHVEGASGLPKPLAGKRQSDVDYWQSRAERTRRQASRYRDQAIRDHFMKIAAGYDELARSARSVRGETETT